MSYEFESNDQRQPSINRAGLFVGIAILATLVIVAAGIFMFTGRHPEPSTDGSSVGASSVDAFSTDSPSIDASSPTTSARLGSAGNTRVAAAAPTAPSTAVVPATTSPSAPSANSASAVIPTQPVAALAATASIVTLASTPHVLATQPPLLVPSTTVQTVRAITPVGVSASCQAPDSEDSQHNPITFNPLHLVDGDVKTAWRCVGDATGQRIVLELDGPHHVLLVGLIPGYDKIDPFNGTDRFVENRRVSSVQWACDNGDTARQTFEDQRSMQYLNVDFAGCATLTITITGTLTPGGTRDFTPISEVEVDGV